MPGEIDRVLERVRQGRAARERELLVPRTRASEAESRGGAALVAGGRAFDTVSGQDVEVVDVGLPFGIGAEAVRVRLPDRSIVERAAVELVARPTPPVAR